MIGNSVVKIRSGPLSLPVALIISLLVFGLLATSGAAYAAGLNGESNTYVQSRERADGSKLLPVYEYLNFTAQGNDDDDVTMHFGGWLRYDQKAENNEDKTANDLQYAYVNVKDRESRMSMKFGRVMVFEGVAAERIDGAYARFAAGKGVSVSAFGGSAAVTNEGNGTNTIFGGRIAHQIEGVYSVGFSYLKQNSYPGSSTDINPSREEEGIDIWVRPMNKVELLGKSSYNAITNGWMQHNYYLVLGPFDKVRFNTEVSKYSYADYFASATSSVFRFQVGGVIDPRETVSIFGEEVVYSLSENLNLSVDYKNNTYDTKWSARSYGAKAAYSSAKTWGCGAAYHVMSGDTDRLSYKEYRVYAFRKIGHVDVAADLFDVKYDTPINDVSNSYAASIAAGYELSERLKVGADAEYSKNPDFDKDVRLFLKLNYRFDAELGKRKGV